MTKRRKQNSLGFGSDSFLDIVANMVGILIILVVVVGARIQDAPPAVAHETKPASPPKVSPTPIEQPQEPEQQVKEPDEQPKEPPSEVTVVSEKPIDLAGPVTRMVAAQGHFLAASVNLRRMQQETALRHQERTSLAVRMAMMESRLEVKQRKLSVEQNAQFESQRQVAQAERQFRELNQRENAVRDLPGKVQKIEHRPTPL
ncbi:MAG: hypothetical protein N2C14_11815, partial [Planctomycetales bacterium]